ncbi:class I SAM-dependent methyltransferase [Micromonospora sp. U21]|uniref:class I SAM-dependent methyltransferase n=1 Tax=Micromonospora sp. U21 TaxID=2824899 RepID=UPI001B364C40|nr:class I SAM-dependent methyltransferase [Micromonospora sp. U21]MBQ0906369.1 class I SAM-dependent methyltransferase [Micromonospora sp. U21]
MDGADLDCWSAVAAGWAEFWGGFPEPAWSAVAQASGIGPGSRVLDVGCGSGELLAYLDRLGASTAGVDPAPGMIEVARARATGADIRLGRAEQLPWPDGEFDLVTSFNALQFADDVLDALTEFVRVAAPGGLVAISNWAEAARNDLNTIEDAVAYAAGEQPRPIGGLWQPGGLGELLGAGGLDVVSAGLVEVPWHAPDDDALVRGVLLGEDPATMATAAPTVIAAARRFRTPPGGYRLVNAFRYAVGRTPGDAFESRVGTMGEA